MSVFSAQIPFKNTHQNVAGTALVHTGKSWAGGVIGSGLATPRRAYTQVSLDNAHGSKITFPRQYLCSSSKAVASPDLNVHRKVPPAFLWISITTRECLSLIHLKGSQIIDSESRLRATQVSFLWTECEFAISAVFQDFSHFCNCLFIFLLNSFNLKS